MKSKFTLPIFFILLSLMSTSCDEEIKAPPAPPKPLLSKAPIFSAENAYQLIAKQLDFGPRVPNSAGHKAMGTWLSDTLSILADTIYIQQADLKAFDGKILASKNIIASFNPSNKKRIIIAAHWDTRPFADQDDERKNEAILGANDGASGVAILLELANILKENPINVGVDLIFFDSEDYGQPAESEFPYMENSYCLGSQYWSKNLHTPGYSAEFGILLDMVGAKNAVFTQEGHSVLYANNYVQKVWQYAHLLGYNSYFSFEKTARITDDHYYVNTLANIPMLDIIQYDHSTPSGFGTYWHTHEDNIEAIDINTLKAVGQTVTQVIYQFNQGNF